MQADKQKVLIIDDDVSNIKVISSILGSDYEMICATRGEEGMELARTHLPDIILLDIVMIDMDGYEVCAQLKSDPRTADIPVIFVTCLDASEQEVLGFEAGAIDYVRKPLCPPILQARVRSQLKQRASQTAPDETAAQEPVAAKHEGDELSERQKEIVRWVHQGKTNWEIAQIIGSSETNIKYHMKQILAKLDAYNRTQAVAKAVSLRIITSIEPPPKS